LKSDIQSKLPGL